MKQPVRQEEKGGCIEKEAQSINSQSAQLLLPLEVLDLPPGTSQSVVEVLSDIPFLHPHILFVLYWKGLLKFHIFIFSGKQEIPPDNVIVAASLIFWNLV